MQCNARIERARVWGIRIPHAYIGSFHIQATVVHGDRINHLGRWMIARPFHHERIAPFEGAFSITMADPEASINVRGGRAPVAVRSLRHRERLF